jgi:carboxyl-terminal processing protease
LAVTTAKYFTPSGKDINKQGIKPDVDVDLNKEDIRLLMQERQRVATKDDPQYAQALITLQSRIAAQNAAPTAITQPKTTIN